MDNVKFTYAWLTTTGKKSAQIKTLDVKYVCL